MKIILLFAIGILTFSNNIAQTNRDAIQGALEGPSKNKQLEYTVRSEVNNPDRGGSTICDSLLVQTTPNNGYEGVMFDMHVLNFVTLLIN